MLERLNVKNRCARAVPTNRGSGQKILDTRATPAQQSVSFMCLGEVPPPLEARYGWRVRRAWGATAEERGVGRGHAHVAARPVGTGLGLNVYAQGLNVF